MRRYIAATSLAVLGLTVATLVWAGPLQLGEKVPAPAGFVQVSPCVAQMGAHYARTSELPFGPILGYDPNGKLIFFEYMISQKEFSEGISWKDLPGVAGRAVDHVDIDFNPRGHEGYEVPHYDLHFYFISTEEEHGLCPNGIKVEHGPTVVEYKAP